MKKYLLIYCFCGSLFCHAQGTENLNTQFAEIFSMLKTQSLIVGRNAGIKGTPLLGDNWGKGSVKFSNGRILKDAMLQFNVYTNKLEIKIDNVEYAINGAIDEFTFSYEEQGKMRSVFFRSGYETGGNIFYEVLSAGQRYQLLKKNYKIIQDYYDYYFPRGKIYKSRSELYIYDATVRKLIFVKNHYLLADLMPGQAEAIAQITGNTN